MYNYKRKRKNDKAGDCHNHSHNEHVLHFQTYQMFIANSLMAMQCRLYVLRKKQKKSTGVQMLKIAYFKEDLERKYCILLGRIIFKYLTYICKT